MRTEVACCCEDSDFLAEEYKVAELRLQTMPCESNDAVLRENVQEVKTGKQSESLRLDINSKGNGKAGRVFWSYKGRTRQS